jgi:hypothetical protein
MLGALPHTFAREEDGKPGSASSREECLNGRDQVSSIFHIIALTVEISADFTDWNLVSPLLSGKEVQFSHNPVAYQ